MPRATTDDILTMLPSLSDDEREEVRQRLVVLKQFSGSKPTRRVNPLETEDWILEGIKTVLHRRGIDELVDFKIKRDGSFKGYEPKSAKVRRLLERAAPGLTLLERHYLGEVAAHELAAHIESWGPSKVTGEKVPVSLRTLLHFVERIPQVLDQAFPGYIQSQLLGVIVTHQIK